MEAVITEIIMMQGLMGLAGCIIPGLFWYGVMRNI